MTFESLGWTLSRALPKADCPDVDGVRSSSSFLFASFYLVMACQVINPAEYLIVYLLHGLIRSVLSRVFG